MLAGEVRPVPHLLGRNHSPRYFHPAGIRSPAATKHLSRMQRGDLVLFYHSQQELAVVGIMQVQKESYPDPTSSNPRWLTCDFAPVKTLARPVPLAAIKSDPRLVTLALVRQPRLAVMPLTAEQFRIIVGISKDPLA